MDILQIDRTYRNIKRYRQIIGVFISYGFGGIIEQLNIDYYLALGKSIVTLNKGGRKKLIRYTKAQRLRMALEELGPTFVKLGQLLSTRPDLIPPSIVNELKHLQDQVSPFPYADVVQVIESSLARPLAEMFPEFNREPVAAASMSQVHQARLATGELVAVKIQRPGITQTIETDIDIMMSLAYLIAKHIPELQLYDPVGIVKEFAKTIRKELDFQVEGRHLDRFGQNFADDPTVSITSVHWPFTAREVLTMGWIEGVKISERQALIDAGLDPKIVARNGATLVLRQVLEFGIFHGDPHPGNLFVLPGNVIAPLDFGIVGHLDEEQNHLVLDLLMAVINRDIRRLTNVLSAVGVIDEDRINMRELRADLYDFVDRYYNIPLQQIEVGSLIRDFIAITSHHHIRFLPDMMLLLKALMTIESVGRSLDPDFDMISHATPFVKQLLTRKMSPEYLAKVVWRRVQEFQSLVEMLPRETQEIIKKLSKGKLKIEFEHVGLDPLGKNLDRITNRLSFSLIISATIVASSLIMQTNTGFMFMGYPVLGIIGYLVAGGLGFWLAIAILRSGRI
ncbi:MAG: ubiquinone biosynthesis protein UbiB [Deltaproteobacteria bacterium]|nr:ubiquinone biosynthesis protein UbiB [Candidatus Anaeroferrophillus wilburensis]MBN2888208.1 ubiquinone biosynthesis protein UbiB [Deltaproteobacteria bacterium]